jgi:hypothetical protein
VDVVFAWIKTLSSLFDAIVLVAVLLASVEDNNESVQQLGKLLRINR